MKKVFVSHPYADNPERNRRHADKVCRELYQSGVLPVSPLHMFAFLEDDNARADIMQICFALIEQCDELNVYGDSEGTREEVKHAYACGIKVNDYSVDNFDRFMRERSEIHVK